MFIQNSTWVREQYIEVYFKPLQEYRCEFCTEAIMLVCTVVALLFSGVQEDGWRKQLLYCRLAFFQSSSVVKRQGKVCGVTNICCWKSLCWVFLILTAQMTVSSMVTYSENFQVLKSWSCSRWLEGIRMALFGGWGATDFPLYCLHRLQFHSDNQVHTRRNRLFLLFLCHSCVAFWELLRGLHWAVYRQSNMLGPSQGVINIISPRYFESLHLSSSGSGPVVSLHLPIIRCFGIFSFRQDHYHGSIDLQCWQQGTQQFQVPLVLCSSSLVGVLCSLHT